VVKNCQATDYRFLKLISEDLSLRISGCKQVNNPSNSGVSFVVSGLEFGGGWVELSRSAVKESVGQRAADRMVKEDEHQGNGDALVG
jgi:hypothetical protein